MVVVKKGDVKWRLSAVHRLTRLLLQTALQAVSLNLTLLGKLEGLSVFFAAIEIL